MSHQVLARKWRPRTFQELIGQEHILRMLTNALTQNRIHHAYLFSGTRGVGKTTIARILAKSLNCEAGVSPTPCGQCATCQAIDQGQFLDLYEVDAASRTKVEDTRDLLENVCYPPTQGRYKIYLIDEVHMLSNHSFNALLKTLEEPPHHVKFLFATTEPKRLPITILSRCLQFHLKRIPESQIANYLSKLCQSEQITYDEQAIKQLAHAADGSMRDALSLLDQAIAYGSGLLNSNDISDMLGNVAQEDLTPLLTGLAEKNINHVFQAIQTLSDRGVDFQQVLELIANLLHQAALHQFMPKRSVEHPAALLLANQLSPEDIQLYYQIVLLGRRDFTLAPTPEIGFEMTLLRMLAFQAQATSSQPLTTPPPAADTPSTSAKDSDIKQSPTPAQAINQEPPTFTHATLPSQHMATSHDWSTMLPKLELSGMAYALAANCVLTRCQDGQVELSVSQTHQPMLNDKLKERVKDALSRYLGHPVQLTIHTTKQTLLTPVKQQEQQQSEQLANARNKVLSNPKIQRFIELYDASVDVNIKD